MDQQELVSARSLLWALHRLGGPSPAALSERQLIERYRAVLLEQSQLERGTGWRVKGTQAPTQ